MPQVRLWQRLEIESAADLPSFLDEIVAAGADLPDADRRRLTKAARRPRGPRSTATPIGSKASLDGGTDDWALGRERYDELVALRAFDGLDADAILAIGEEQLESTAPRGSRPPARSTRTRTRRPSSTGSRATIPASVRGSPRRLPRRHGPRPRATSIEHGIVTVPDDERIDVIPTPEYLRNVIPFAAYFSPPKFDPNPKGIYIVTPSVGNDPNAMREHNFSSISNTSIHEAYPGHHLQLAVANRHPSLTRLAHGRPGVRRGLGHVLRADDARAGLRRRPELPARPVHRRDLAGVPDHPRRPDAPRRDQRRRGHRLPRLATRASRARTPGPRSIATRTRRPTSCRTCSARSCCSSSAPTSSGGSGRGSTCGRSTTRCSTTAPCRSASTAGCCARRSGPPRARAAPAASRAARAPEPRRAGHPLDRHRPRPLAGRVLARRLVRRRRADGSAGPDRRAIRRARRARRPRRRLRRRPDRRARQPRGDRSDRVADRRPDPARRRPRGAGSDPPRVRGGRDPGRPGDERRRRSAACSPIVSASPATGSPSAWTRGRSDSPRSRGDDRAVPTFDGDRRRARRRAASGGSSCRTAARSRTASCWPASHATHDADFLVAGGVSDLDGIRRLRDIGVAGIILGQALLSGAVDFIASPGGRRMTRPIRSLALLAVTATLAAACNVGGTPAPTSSSAASTAPSQAASSGADRHLPDDAATAAGGRREAPRDDRDGEGCDRDHDRGGPRRRSRPATSSPSPGAATTTGSSSIGSIPGFVDPGRRPDRDGKRRTRLHDQG